MKITILLFVGLSFLALFGCERKLIRSESLDTNEISILDTYGSNVACSEIYRRLSLKFYSNPIAKFFELIGDIGDAVLLSGGDKLFFIQYGPKWTCCFSPEGCPESKPKNNTNKRGDEFEYEYKLLSNNDRTFGTPAPVYVVHTPPLATQAQRYRIVLRRNGEKDVVLRSGIAGPSCVR